MSTTNHKYNNKSKKVTKFTNSYTTPKAKNKINEFNATGKSITKLVPFELDYTGTEGNKELLKLFEEYIKISNLSTVPITSSIAVIPVGYAEEIEKQINITEIKSKVAIFNYELYLYNIKNFLEDFITKNPSVKTLEYTAFIEGINNNLTESQNKYSNLKNLIKSGKTTKSNVELRKMVMYIPKLLDVQSSTLSGGTIDIKKFKEIEKQAGTIRNDFGTGWEDITSTSTGKNYYGFNTDEPTINTSKAYTLSKNSEKIQLYMNKCNDLQILYLHKHIELYDIFVSMRIYVLLNVEINKIIKELLDPEESKSGQSNVDIKMPVDILKQLTEKLQTQKDLSTAAAATITKLGKNPDGTPMTSGFNVTGGAPDVTISKDIFNAIKGNTQNTGKIGTLVPGQIIYITIQGTAGTSDETIMMTYKGEDNASNVYKFNNLLVASSKDANTIFSKISSTTDKEKIKMEYVDYMVDSVDSYEILQFIKNIQLVNEQSLSSMLGINSQDNLQKIVDEYKLTIKGIDKTIKSRKLTTISKGWESFNNSDTNGLYFEQTQLDKDFSSEVVSDKDKIQPVIYKCYDLQILYLVKHLEIIEMYKMVYYFDDMLTQKIGVLFFILSLYKLFKVSVKKFEIQIRKILSQLPELLKLQGKTMSGGALTSSAAVKNTFHDKKSKLEALLTVTGTSNLAKETIVKLKNITNESSPEILQELMKYFDKIKNETSYTYGYADKLLFELFKENIQLLTQNMPATKNTEALKNLFYEAEKYLVDINISRTSLKKEKATYDVTKIGQFSKDDITLVDEMVVNFHKAFEHNYKKSIDIQDSEYFSKNYSKESGEINTKKSEIQNLKTSNAKPAEIDTKIKELSDVYTTLFADTLKLPEISDLINKTIENTDFTLSGTNLSLQSSKLKFLDAIHSIYLTEPSITALLSTTSNTKEAKTDELFKALVKKIDDDKIYINPTDKTNLDALASKPPPVLVAPPVPVKPLPPQPQPVPVIPTMVSYEKAIKQALEYNGIVKDIIFIMTSFNNKSIKVQNEIEKSLGDESDKTNIDSFNKIKENYKKLNNEIMKILKNNEPNLITKPEIVDKLEIDETQKANILVLLTQINNNIGLEASKLSDLYEIIVGTARVTGRFKPKQDDNTAPEIPITLKKAYTLRDYFDSLGGNIAAPVVQSVPVAQAAPAPVVKTAPVAALVAANNEFGFEEQEKSVQTKYISPPKKIEPESEGFGFENNKLMNEGGDNRTNQTGGYNYEEIIKVKDNKLQIQGACDPNGDNPSGLYGPFYSIYPPQYNNFHVYYNMFGHLKLSELNNPEMLKDKDKYKRFLSNPLPELKNSRSFDTSEITNIPHNLMDKLNRGGSVVIFGYGFSGSGKTYSLIAGSEKPVGTTDRIKYDPSILEQFIKDNSDKIKTVDFLEVYPLGITHNPHDALSPASKKIISYTINHETVKLSKLKEYNAQQNFQKSDTEYELKHFTPCKNDAGDEYNLFKSINKSDDDFYNIINTRIKLLERHRIAKLRILATPNNNESSRSFLQITINLEQVNGKTPKLVFFDMPGTENTVRIKTEFLGEGIFSEIKQNKFTEIELPRDTSRIEASPFDQLKQYSTYNFKYYIDDLKDEPNKPKNNKIEYLRIHNFTKLSDANNAEINEIAKIFKYFFMSKGAFGFIDVVIPGENEVISHDGLEFALFINGLDVKRGQNFMETYNNIPNGTKIFFLTNKLFTDIYQKFNNFLNKKDKNNKPIYNSDQPNDYCKIPYPLEGDDIPYLKSIFNVDVSQDKNIVMTNSERIYLFSSKLPNNKQTNKHYFANPLIKYIYLILDYLKSINISNVVDPIMKFMPKQHLHRASVFFIYKYINFIVNQGRTIVTNLEHLKYFFLSRTGLIKKYNEDEKNIKENKSFLCSVHDCSDITTSANRQEYVKPTIVGGNGGITIYERVNIGNMQTFGLIDILQGLSSSPLLKDCAIEITDKGSWINLLKSKTSSTGGKLGAIFVMFTNFKIFFDNTNVNPNIDTDPIANIKSSLNTLCIAAKDTAEFAESISSTSISSSSPHQSAVSAAAPPPSSQPRQQQSSTEELRPRPPKGSPQRNPHGRKKGGGTTKDAHKKFNLKDLLKSNKHKPKTHKNISLKNNNKKNKVLYTRTKKNRL